MSWRGYGRSAAGVRERRERESVEWGIATRSRRGEATSGDLAVVKLLPEGALVAGIDGLGHGTEAARASRKAAEVVRESPSQDLVILVKRCHAALRGTRGAAISLAFISTSESEMTWLGVGNVEGRVLSGDPWATRPKGSLALERGVPGHELPAMRTATLRVSPGDVMILATDGIEPRFADSPDISGSTQAISDRILAEHWKQPDDALVVAVRYLGARVMSTGAEGGAASPFRDAYAAALGDYLRRPTESALRVAYELGREAVSRQLTVLDLAVIHQETVLSALASASDLSDIRQASRSAGDFFLESLSSFEMVQRGFKEARQAFLDERRQTELSRQLSTFLNDASLALDASDSLAEMLWLVAERARELVGADCCMVTVAVEGEPRSVQAASHPEDDRRWTTFTRWLDLPAIYRLIRANGGSVRIAGERLAALPIFPTAAGGHPLQGWLATSLTALDGSELGALQLFDKRSGAFSVEDEAALLHLAQMASAAVERTRLYQNRSSPR